MTRYYYWLVCQDETGKPYLIYGGESEEEARQKGLEMLNGVDFTIKRLPTRSLPHASSLLKGNRLEEYHNLRKATQRLGHDRSFKRAKQRRNIGEYL